MSTMSKNSHRPYLNSIKCWPLYKNSKGAKLQFQALFALRGLGLLIHYVISSFTRNNISSKKVSLVLNQAIHTPKLKKS